MRSQWETRAHSVDIDLVCERHAEVYARVAGYDAKVTFMAWTYFKANTHARRGYGAEELLARLEMFIDGFVAGGASERLKTDA